MDKYKRYFRKGISIAAKKKAMNAKNKIRFYGWKKDTDKPKTILYSPVKHFLPLPSYVDLQPKCPPGLAGKTLPRLSRDQHYSRPYS